MEQSSLRQRFSVSRRKAVAFVAGTLAASVGPVTGRASAAASGREADAMALVEGRPRMLELLQLVRRAHGSSSRTRAFERFATAFRAHEVAESLAAAAPGRPGGVGNGRRTTLYRQREPATVLASVILRELETSPQSDAAWMTRFRDLEAVIHTATPA